jgi:hypothetical protein
MACAKEKVFHDIPMVKSFKERLDIKLMRHRNKYFIDKNLDTIDPTLSVLVRPIVKVNSKNLLNSVSNDQQSKVRKIDWVLNRTEPFAAAVIEKYENEEYDNFLQIYNDCWPICEKYDPEYRHDKKTVSSLNGVKVYKKKGQTSVDNQNDENTTREDENLRNNQLISNRIKGNVDKLIHIQKLSNDELKANIENCERFEEVSAISGLNNPNRKETRIAFLTVATVLDLINKSD